MCFVQSALKVKWRRDSKYHKRISDVAKHIESKMESLDLALSGQTESMVAYEKSMTPIQRGEYQCMLGHRAYFGHGMTQNFETAFKYYRVCRYLCDFHCLFFFDFAFLA